MPCAFIPYTSQSARINGGRNGWENEPEPCSTYLVGDEVLTHRQRHLNSVGFVGDGDGVEFKPVSAVHHACLVHRILKHLLVPLLAQHRADVHDFHLAATRSAGAGEQNQEHQEAHGGKNPKSSSGSAVWDQEQAPGTLFRGGKFRVRGSCSLRRNAHGHWSDAPFASARISYTVRAALLHWSYLHHPEIFTFFPWTGVSSSSKACHFKPYFLQEQNNCVMRCPDAACPLWEAMRRERPELLSAVLLTAGLVCWTNRYIIPPPPLSYSFYTWTSMDASLHPVVYPGV